MQDNNCIMTRHLAQRCQVVVLRLLLCGAYQPPLRAGALRVLMARSQWGQDCVCEKCK
jgi:hypothetical protein